MAKKCLLLLNVGTPDSPEKKDVRKYLSQFLNDKYVVDLPWLLRKILVNGIIVPFRVNTSVKIYGELWAKYGRILDTITQSLTHKLQGDLGAEWSVKYAMRYGNPSIEKAVKEMQDEGIEELILFPLFPHNAMSTVTTSIEGMREVLAKEKLAINMQIIPAFFNNADFIKGIAAQAKQYNWQDYDHVLFSYHGLPNRHIRKAHKSINYPLRGKKVCDIMPFEEKHTGCYKAECYETSRLIAKEMGIPEDKYTVAFQSRLSRDWMRPFSDLIVKELAEKGAKKILAFTPSFIIDCLETVNEIGEEYAEEFYEAGGKQLDLVACINDSDEMLKLTKTLLEKL